MPVQELGPVGRWGYMPWDDRTPIQQFAPVHQPDFNNSPTSIAIWGARNQQRTWYRSIAPFLCQQKPPRSFSHVGLLWQLPCLKISRNRQCPQRSTLPEIDITQQWQHSNTLYYKYIKEHFHPENQLFSHEATLSMYASNANISIRHRGKPNFNMARTLGLVPLDILPTDLHKGKQHKHALTYLAGVDPRSACCLCSEHQWTPLRLKMASMIQPYLSHWMGNTVKHKVAHSCITCTSRATGGSMPCDAKGNLSCTYWIFDALYSHFK